MHQRFFRAAAVALVAGAAAVVQAALPTFWQVSTEAEFLRGDVENLSIDTYGRLTLGPASTTLYEPSAPFLWTVVGAPDGTVYAGSGNEGQVYRVDPSGQGTVYFDSDELEVHAMALAPGGGLYVGSSPDGKIYKVDSAGKGTVFFDPEDRYIWSLAVDRTGNVFAATGDTGVIYKITPDGKGAPFYETKATHAMALAFDRDGNLLAGTESPGRVFRIDPSGRPFVLLDSNYNEIRMLRVDASGNIYAAAVMGRSSQGAPPAPPPEPAAPAVTPSVSTDITVIAVDGTTVGGAQIGTSPPPPPVARGPAAGALFRIAPDGAWDLVWESREDTPYDVAFENGGTVLVATGNDGKIYRLSGDPLQPTLVVRASAQQVTNLLPDRDGRMVFTTANPGKLLRLSSARADRGTYISDVRDAQTVAAWGTIKWQGPTPAGTRIEISTRSGNTRTPDETWSDWSSAYREPEGSAITSPRARYLQWRAVLTAARGESPLLTSVTAAYLPRNMRPRVTSIVIHPPGTVFQRPFPTDPEIAGFDGELPERRLTQQAQGTPAGGSPSLGRRAYQKGLLTFVWRAEDENRDDLTYDVQYRREGETSWKLLKRAVTDPILVWDTTSVPNGRYLLRIVASDAPSNSPATALSGAMESTAFDIDNAPPSIAVTSVRRDGARVTIAFEVSDEHSGIQKADYSLDGDRWQTIYPKDGIADSRFEEFELELEGEAAARGVILRATDALNNVSSTRGEMPPPASGGR
jgi:outer membrane protein assembly factor BamB